MNCTKVTVPMIILMTLGGAALAGCNRSIPEEPSPGPGGGSAPASPPASAPPPGSASALAPATGGAAAKLPLTWTDPPRWKRHPPSSPMRSAEYLVPRAPGDSDDAECTVITFGASQGGSVDENIDRWAKQFDGAPSPTKSTRTVNGMKMTRVELAGTYHGMRMPGAPPAGPHAGWRMVGEILDAPSGLWFFKLTGPDATVKAAAGELDTMVGSSHGA